MGDGENVISDDAVAKQLASVQYLAVMMGRSASRSWVYAADGVVASVAPDAPRQSMANVVTYRDSAALLAHLGPLAETYQKEGVEAWQVCSMCTSTPPAPS